MEPRKPPAWQVIEVGVDYITATARTQAAREALVTFGQTLTVTEARSGQDVRPFAWMGYRGLSCGPCTWAEREDTAMLRLSGRSAAVHWRTVGTALENCSRLDLQVTARGPGGLPVHEVQWWHEARSGAEDANHNGLVAMVRDNRGGWTLYIGSRTSPRFARVYNKEAESKEQEYKGCVRWEVEYKAEAANQVLRALTGAQSAEPLIRSTVRSHYQDRGVSVPWSANGPSVGPSITRPESDDAIRLRWLANQVAPTLARLHANGRTDDALEALGLRTLLSLPEGQAQAPTPDVAQQTGTDYNGHKIGGERPG